MDIIKKIAMVRRLIKAMLILGSFLFPLIAYCQYQDIPDPAFRQFLINKYPTYMNDNGQLNIQMAATFQGSINCSELGIKDLTGIESFRAISSINCSHNQITYIPSLTNIVYLTSFDCSYNQLTVLPTFNWNSQSIKKINCSHNHLIKLIEFNYAFGLDSLEASYNDLTFEDLIQGSQKSYKQFNYSPQSTIPINGNMTVSIGDTIFFNFPADDTVSSNMYFILKDGKPLTGSSKPYYSNSFQIPISDYSKLGKYQVMVINPFLPGLTLTTTSLMVEATQNNPEVFTPNGDNRDDSYLVNCSGTIRIYNKFGQQIKQLEGSSYWDGTDQQGTEVPLGSYIIRCNDSSEEKVVTVLK